jgi:hypothetical protein
LGRQRAGAKFKLEHDVQERVDSRSIISKRLDHQTMRRIERDLMFAL